MEFKKYNKKEKNGFTLIEIIISILLLSVGVVGVFSAFSVVTILTSDSADRLTAAYLAQEGMEIVRNIRDNNWLNMNNVASGKSSNVYTWTDGLLSCDQGCEADYTTGTGAGGAWVMQPWASTPLYINNTSGFYNYTSTGDTKTKFKRKITIIQVQDVDNKSDHIIMVKAQVSWDEKATILNPALTADTCGAYNCITTEETLYNWYNYHTQ
jgi:prepilin-type N-terminal cleavage/methylation domain-containing protein